MRVERICHKGKYMKYYKSWFDFKKPTKARKKKKKKENGGKENNEIVCSKP